MPYLPALSPCLQHVKKACESLALLLTCELRPEFFLAPRLEFPYSLKERVQNILSVRLGHARETQHHLLLRPTA